MGGPLRVGVLVLSPIDGGGEAYLKRLYSRLHADFGVEATLIGSIPGWPQTEGLMHLPVSGGSKLTARRALLGQITENIAPLGRMGSKAWTGDFDLYHVQYFREKFALPWILSRRRPVVWTEHGVLPDFRPWQLSLLRRQSQYASVIAVSDSVKESLSSARISSTALPNPLPRPSNSDAQRKSGRALLIDLDPGLTSARHVVGYAGRLHPTKRVDLLIGAVRDNPDVRCLIIGDGPDRARLERMAPNNVVFTGHMPSAETAIAGLDCLILPSGDAAREGSPMAMLEARASGTPVLMATDNGAAAEACSLGCDLFEPHISTLSRALRRHDFQPSHLDKETSRKRSEDAWVESHYRLFEQTTSTYRKSI